jgi:hypothetical protein
MLSQGKRQRGFSASRRAEHYHQQGIGRHGQRAPQAM